ncbi:hypothetical protein FRC07_012414, partial [Ceratobasidium sp. 392]
MADFFTTTSVVDKFAVTAAATTQNDEQNTKVVPEVAGYMGETTQGEKGSNFSMCEIIMRITSPEAGIKSPARVESRMPKYTRTNNDSDEELPASQSSNFDGNEEAMSILLKAQATVAKNRKQKENQHLKEAKEELGEILETCAQEYAEHVGEL